MGLVHRLREQAKGSRAPSSQHLHLWLSPCLVGLGYPASPTSPPHCPLCPAGRGPGGMCRYPPLASAGCQVSPLFLAAASRVEPPPPELWWVAGSSPGSDTRTCPPHVTVDLLE